MDPASWVMAGISAAAAIAGTATSIKANHDQKKAAKATQKALAKQAEQTPVYNEKKEMKKAGDMAAEQNRRRVMTETDTIKTSALGNTGTTNVQKKTLLGG